MASRHALPWSGLQLWEKPSVGTGAATARWRFHCIDVMSGPSEWSPARDNVWEVAADAASSRGGPLLRSGHLEVALSVAECRECSVQVSDPHSRGPQLLSLGSCLHLCLEHRLNPLAAFHQGPHRPLGALAQPTLWPSGVRSWPSLEAYTAAWQQLCFMEAATCAVAENDVKLLSSVTVRWTVADEEECPTMVGTFNVPCDLVDAHELKIRRDDLLCIRCRIAGTASAATSRQQLIAAVFQGLNKSGSGSLSGDEMRPFAAFTDFEGDDETWQEEHVALCRELECEPSSGIDLDRFARLVSDNSDRGCYCSDLELEEFLSSQRSAAPGAAGADDRDGDGCSADRGGGDAGAPEASPTFVVHAVVAEAERFADGLQVRVRQRGGTGCGHLPLPGEWKKCLVEVIPLGESYHCTISALRELPDAVPLVRDLAIHGRAPPTHGAPEAPRVGGEDLAAYGLNQSQEEAVRAALSEPVVLIHGPPGTGKTRTAAALALAFARQNVARHAKACVLYAASGNQAVDVAVEAIAALSVQRSEDLFRTQNAESEICSICWSEGCNVITFCGHVFHHHCLTQALRMAARGAARQCPLCRAALKSIDGVRLLRVYSSDAERLDFPVPKRHQYSGVRDRRRRAVPEGMRRFTLHWRIHNKVSGHYNPHAAECEAAYNALVEEGPGGVSFDKARAKYSQAREKARAFELRSCNILLITSCSSRRSWVMKLILQEGVELRQVVVDEAGTSTEPEVLCPLSLSRDAERVVLVGDHRQLRPVVKNRDAASLGLSRSLFERLALQEPAVGEAVTGAGWRPGAARVAGLTAEGQAERSASKPSQAGRPAASREALAQAAFRRLDERQSGRLGMEALRPFAEYTGFSGTDEEWRAEYEALCAALRRSAAEGLDLATFRALVDDESPEGCHCSDAELSGLAAFGAHGADAEQEPSVAEPGLGAVPASVLLRQQYRMHPSMNRFPSRQFYGGQVRDHISTTERPEGLLVHPRSGQRCAVFFWPSPSHFCEEVREVASRDASVRSRANLPEAQRCAELAEALAAHAGAKSVAVLSWYNAQVSELRCCVGAQPHGAGLHCGSVVAAQGSEWDYVLLSTVRSAEAPEQGRATPQLGCLADRHLLNVAVTRGRLGIVVLGSPTALQASRHWVAFVQHCREVGGLLAPEQGPAVHAAGCGAGAGPYAGALAFQ